MRLPYELILFILSMFVLVLTLNYSGFSEKIEQYILSDKPIYAVGISSFLISNIINNIPMSVLYSSVLKAGIGSASYLPAIFAAIIGSNIGAVFTPVGALAGIMWASILKRFKIDFSFKVFVKYGILVSLPTLVATLITLSVVIF